jgi:thioredoxin-like negative regulator of GroEL
MRDQSKLIKYGFNLLAVIALIGVFICNDLRGQDATDKNFKDKTKRGFVVVKFTSKWQEKNLDPKILEGIKGHNDCIILTVASEDAKKVVKKLRIRNYPSIALFYNGSKKEVWKADMDGIVEVSNDEIKSAIDDVLAGDVF